MRAYCTRTQYRRGDIELNAKSAVLLEFARSLYCVYVRWREIHVRCVVIGNAVHPLEKYNHLMPSISQVFTMPNPSVRREGPMKLRLTGKGIISNVSWVYLISLFREKSPKRPMFYQGVFDPAMFFVGYRARCTVVVEWRAPCTWCISTLMSFNHEFKSSRYNKAENNLCMSSPGQGHVIIN